MPQSLPQPDHKWRTARIVARASNDKGTEMLRIIQDGENRFRLENATGIDIGWIRGRALGFRGLSTERAAIQAALDSSRALEITLLREFPGRQIHDVSASRVRLVHNGAYEWIADGDRPLARILRPSAGPFPESDFGIELQLPSYATHHVAIACAHAVWRALRSISGPRRPHRPPSRRAFRSLPLSARAVARVGEWILR